MKHQPSLRMSAAQFRAYVAPEGCESVCELGEDFANEPKKERKSRSKIEQQTNPYEHTIQRVIIKDLRWLLPQHYIVQAFASEHRAADEKIKAKNSGQNPGWPDVGVFGDMRCWLFDVKDKRGTLTDAQKVMFPRIVAAGIPLLPICRNLETAVAFLKANGARFRDGR